VLSDKVLWAFDVTRYYTTGSKKAPTYEGRGSHEKNGKFAFGQ
jgi:hypothetical protein